MPTLPFLKGSRESCACALAPLTRSSANDGSHLGDGVVGARARHATSIVEMLRAAILAGCMLLARTAAAQDVDYSLDATATFYGDNTEFFNPFRDGETLIGVHGFVVGEARTSDHLAIRAGIFGNQRFGSREAFDEWRPVISLVIGGQRSQLILGTHQHRAPRARASAPIAAARMPAAAAADRNALVHATVGSRACSGSSTRSRIKHESWLNWQRVGTADQRERFDAGAVSRFKVHRAITHRRRLPRRPRRRAADRASAPSAKASRERWAAKSAVPPAASSASRSRRTCSARATCPIAPSRCRSAPALPRSCAPRRRRICWRVHAIIFRGDDFITREGDRNYLSIRLDGSGYRMLRDYAEIGVTKLVPLAKDSWLEASFRGHRSSTTTNTRSASSPSRSCGSRLMRLAR